MKRLIAIAPLLMFGAITAALGFSLSNDPSRLPSMLLDKKAPHFNLPPLGDGPNWLTSEDLKGGVSLLNVFASWCHGCQSEHQMLMRLAHNPSVRLFGVNWKDKPGAGARWLAKHGNPYQLVGEDRDARLGLDLGVTGVPETFIIDRNGRIRHRHAGPITEDAWHNVFAPLIEDLSKVRRQ